MDDPGETFDKPPALRGVLAVLLPPMLPLRPLDDRVDSGVDDAEDAEDDDGAGDGPPLTLTFLHLLPLLLLPPPPEELCFLRAMPSLCIIPLPPPLAGVVGTPGSSAEPLAFLQLNERRATKTSEHEHGRVHIEHVEQRTASGQVFRFRFLRFSSCWVEKIGENQKNKPQKTG